MKNPKPHIIGFLSLISLLFIGSIKLSAQCINGAEYIGDTAEIDRMIDTIATDIYTIEYSTIAGIKSGSEYKLTCNRNLGDTARYITITDTFNNVLTHGFSPVTWTATLDGVIRAHYTDNNSPDCSGQLVTHTNTIQCTSCGCFNVLEYGGGIASINDSIVVVSNEIYTEEYAPIAGIDSGSVYLFICKEAADSTHKYITITDTNDGLLASGYSPLEWEATISGNIKAHYTEDEFCNTTTSIIHLATIRCISCPPINDLRPNAIELPILNASDSCDYHCIGSSVFLENATADILSLPCDSQGPNRGVWYTFTTGPAQESITLYAELLNFAAAPAELAVLDPMDSVIFCTAFTHLEDEVLDCLTPSTTYTIFIWNDNNAFNNGVGICLKDQPATIVNDIKSGAISIDVRRPGNCSPDSSTTADLTKASPDPEDCSGENPWGLWYLFNTGTSDTVVSIRTFPFSYAAITILDEFDNTVYCGFTNDEVTGLKPNTNYYLLVHRYFPLSITFCLESFPVPINDQCTNAEMLTIQSAGDCSMSLNQISGSTKGAYNSGVATSCFLNNWDGIPINHDVWYKFTTNGSQTAVQINTYNFNNVVLNHILAIFDDCAGTNEIFCTTTPNQSHIVSGLSPNTTYYLMLSGDDENTADFKICLEEPPAPPANDQCSSAIPVNVLNAGANCFAPISANISGATTSNELPIPGCNRLPVRNGVSSTLNGDLWFQFQIPASGELLLELGAVGWTDFSAAVYSGNCGSLVLEDCVSRSFGQDSLYLSCLSGGAVGYLRVWTTAKTGITEFCLKQVASPIPDNNTCACAESLLKSSSNCENSLSGNTINATRTFLEEFSLQSEPEVWYAYTSTAPITESIEVEVSNFSGSQNPQFASIVIYVGSGCQSLQESVSEGTNSVTFLADPGITYFIALSTWKLDNSGYQISAMGSFDICLKSCSPPVNSHFNSATPIAVDQCINGTTKCASGPNSAVYFKFTPNASGPYTVESTNTGDGGTSFICLYNDTTFTLDCGGSPFTYCMDKGQDYYFAVATYDTNGFPILEDLSICLRENGINDVCGDAIPLTLNRSFNGDFACPRASGMDFSSCTFSGGDIWFSATVPPSGELYIFTDSDSDGPPLSMQVFEGSCDELIPIACAISEEYFFDFISEVSVSGLIPGTTLFIALGLDVYAPDKYDFYSEQGSFRIKVEDLNPDFCPDELLLSGSIIGSANLVAADLISSNQIVESGADVIYDAGNSTELNSGFDVKLGALFKIFSDGCVPIPLIDKKNRTPNEYLPRNIQTARRKKFYDSQKEDFVGKKSRKK